MCAVSIRTAVPGVNPAPSPDQAPTWTLPPDATSPDADPLETALAYAAAGWWIFPIAAGSKRPLIGAWQHAHGTPAAAACEDCQACARRGRRPKHRAHGATRDPAVIRRWWTWWPFAAVGLSHRLSGTLSLDPDTKPGRNGWATLEQLRGDGLTLPATPTFRTASGGGQFILARPPDLADLAGNHAGELGPGVDLVLGFSLLPSGTATPGRVWDFGADQAPAPAPGWTVAKRRAAREESAARAEAAAHRAPVTLPGAGRAAAYLRPTFDGAAAAVAALPEGERQNGLIKVGRELGFALTRVERPDLAGAAEEALASAAPWADTRKERDTIRRAIAWGIEHGRPGLPDRPGWAPAAELPPGGLAEGEAVPTPEEVQAAALAMLADLPELVAGLIDENGRPIHPASRPTVELAAGELCRLVLDTGRPWASIGPAALGLAIDRGPDAVRRAGPWLDRIGWTLTPGGWTDDGAPRAAHYRLSAVFATRCGDSVCRCRMCAGGLEGAGGEFNATCRKNPAGDLEGAAITLARGAEAAGDLSRGMRRRLGQRPTEGEDTRPKAAGGTVHKVLEALPRIGEADAGQLAEAAGVSRRTAERQAARLVERGTWTRRTAAATGRGRPRVLYAVADQAGPLVAATLEAGRRAKARAQATIEAFRDLCRRAFAAVERGLYATHRAAVSALARAARCRAKAERDATLPGRARQLGRTDTGERAAALRETRAWGRTIRECLALRPAVLDLDPPAWATAPAQGGLDI